MINLIAKYIRRSLRSHWGIEIAYAKYCPHLSERKVINHYLGVQTKIGMIFDVGANVGQSALEYAKSFPEAEIHSFEPFEANFNELVHNTRDIVAIRRHHLALSDRRCSLDVLVDNVINSEWNSITDKRQGEMKASPVASKEAIVLCRGDSFCNDQKISRIDILKIDTEGHDFEVIQGFQGMFETGSISSVIVEVGFLEDQTHGNFQKINNYLIGRGMQLAGFYETCYFESGKCEYTNALYLKNK
jgi:FkbM family methyltransferase